MSKELSFEDAIRRLDKIILQLNSSDISLEEAMALYTESAALIEFSTKVLNSAKLKIEEIYPENFDDNDNE